MKNSTLNKKLKQYSAVAAGAVVAAPAMSQIVYTDITPDQVLSAGNQYALNFDGDAQDDFYFSHFSRTGTYFGGAVNYSIDAGGLTAPSGNGFVGSTSTIGTMASGFYPGITIASSFSFINASALLGGYLVATGFYSTSTPIGDFIPSERFLACQFMIGANTHYGWVRIEVTADGLLTIIKDYAYESTPNGPIDAGDTGTGTAGIGEGDISDLIDVNPNHHELLINVSPELDNATLRITNLTGALVMESGLNAGNSAASLEDHSQGVYVVTITADQGIYTQKIYR